LTDEDVWHGMQVTARFVVSSIALQVVIGFGLALLINRGFRSHGFWTIVLVDSWMWTPYVMLICLAGLRSIPDYIYEAAEVDRASPWRQFWSITLPMVLPFLMLAVLFRAIEAFKMFDLVNLLTSGGPGSTTELASITLKREAFEKWRTGYSSAFAIILFVTVFGAANIYVKTLNRVKRR